MQSCQSLLPFSCDFAKDHRVGPLTLYKVDDRLKFVIAVVDIDGRHADRRRVAEPSGQGRSA